MGDWVGILDVNKTLTYTWCVIDDVPNIETNIMFDNIANIMSNITISIIIIVSIVMDEFIYECPSFMHYNFIM